ncbi:MAG: T9SS type A sorting domain-containing protein [Ignavibacteriae bacterium]|nr:T9SS type A sorting domain-containing protein [Ignavibacteriota bacterium]
MSSGWPGTSAVVFTNNNLAARQRGIFLNYGGNTEIAGNEISVNQTGTGYLTYGIMPNAIATGSTINVYNNKIVQLSTGNSNAGTYGIIGIYAGVAGTWNVYNNMVSGFATTTATVDPPIARIWGIQVATVTANVYHNTVYMPDLAYTPGPTNGQNYSGIYITSGTVALMNNIVFSVESSDTSFAIYRPGTTGLTSDYNDFVVSSPGFVGNWNSSVQQTLADWQTASGQDATSKSKIVIFISPTDLHLVAGSIGDTDLAGIALPSVTTDIDGQARPANAPYMGADEHPESPLPVQLISFTAQLQNASVVLRWRTLSEINNYGFYVQKRRVGDQSWNEIAGSFVAGNGTTNDPHDYAYTDNTIASGLWQYRLKQVDLDNSIHFTDPIQVDIVTNVKESTPTQFVLTQNYPNPFNPSTTIRFEIAKPEFVTLKVYDMLGREVAMLANETLQAGSYSAAFNASHLASGTYIYRLQAGAFIATKKMSLTK